jgi:hypothetical protein
MPMNPTSAKQVTTAEKVQRRVMCQHYGACLDKALRAGWPGFSCDKCADYTFEGLGDLNYWEDQNQRAARILNKILVARAPRYKGS